MLHRIILPVICVAALGFSQSEDAYSSGGDEKKAGGLAGLLDPSRFSIRHSVSFGAMSSTGVNGLQSQSLYTTMMRYQFAAPVTLNLNFGLPIHSTLSSAQNLNSSNLQSLDYFKSMPFEMSLSWQPSQNTLLQLNIVKAPAGSYYFNNFGYDGFDSYHRYHRWP
ncbi:MAG: hypothetical protein JW863_23555 [Chitinispirillaceae bacterium]|nr:hypothetical protein [Chitinispirillaceae bacterium]